MTLISFVFGRRNKSVPVRWTHGNFHLWFAHKRSSLTYRRERLALMGLSKGRRAR